MNTQMFRIILMLIIFSKLSFGRRILVVFPVPSRAHHVLGDSIVDTLLEAGHEVTYVTPFPKEPAAPTLAHVNISSAFHEHDYSVEHSPSAHRPLQRGAAIMEHALRHTAVKHLLEDPTEMFDLVIADWYYSGLLAPTALLYDCPLIWYSCTDLHWQSLRLVHEASSPAYTVDQNSRLPETPFNVWERAHQLWLQMYLTTWSYYISNYVESPVYGEIYRNAMRIREQLPLPEYESLVFNASMLLVNSHPPLGQNIPLPNNVKYVGGHHVEFPIKPLPQDLKRVLDKARNGVILFNMNLDPQRFDVPERSKRQLVQFFGRLEQTVIWSTDEILQDLPRNVHKVHGIPAISILNHPNTVISITSGDMLSNMEAAHCGVPVIGIPAFGDEFVNVDVLVAGGWGIKVDSRNLVSQLNDAIYEIIGNFTYRSRAKVASTIFRRRTTPAHAELLHWVHLVLDTRGAQHLRSPARSLPIIERLYLDILVSSLMVIWFLTKVHRLIKVHTRDDDDDEDKKNQ